MEPQFDLVIRGGTVATAADIFSCDIGIAGAKVVALARDLPRGTDEIDATGLLVLPGGIDSHVHLDQYQGEGIVMADGFETGSRSAAAGGNTCIVPYALQRKGQSLREAVADYHVKAAGNSLLDYGFHLIISDPTPAVLGQELPALIADGYTSVKIFMTYDDLVLKDREILEVLSIARQYGAMVMIHAEGYDQIKFMTDKLEQAGKTAPYYHAASRPQLVEREATHRAIAHAELVDVPVMIVHVSGGEAMEQIEWARSKGIRVYAETCPQYLVLTADHLKGLNMDHAGTKYVCSPPPRDRASQEAIWRGIVNGTFQTFSSDHCPFRYEDTAGKSNPKSKTSFRWVPNGIPGVAARMPILFSEGVTKGRISLQRFVELTSTNHAKLFGMYPAKGTIAIGSDADITLWDPSRKVTMTQSLMHHGSDYTPYEGMEVRGWPVTTILRGKVIFDEGVALVERGFGQFLTRDAAGRI
ncbi:MULTISPECIES: dihydropyrimidinase [unclassified Rhizobium]|mgnify:FL=1|jgi:dihydropyrimidinase|uniref:dihydropyrimidinase n=1 Tax=unclassified Rhizobium TaxID=2613769 RepID=UPI0006466717|nr:MULTISPECIES: dihydropyrimidinase [unclassified Rhizobium]OJY72078.1 MAG: dihydropyrimidinase [Rhizobium sp. 60-20]RKD36073.1 dihydropyrimidinase [Rhizobium sp. WW_1]